MCILQYDPKRVTQVIFFDFADIDAIVADFSILNVIKTVDQVGNRCLSGSGTSDKGDLLTRSSKKIYIVENDFVRIIAKVDIVEYDITF